MRFALVPFRQGAPLNLEERGFPMAFTNVLEVQETPWLPTQILSNQKFSTS